MRIIRILPAAAAVAALAACSPHTAITPGAAPTCHQQYARWKTGPAGAGGARLTAALSAVQSAGASDDIILLKSGLVQAGAAARRLQAYPLPACADPAGYWRQALADIRAAGDNATAASGLDGLVEAEVPLQKVPGLEAELKTEIQSTAG